MFGISQRLYSKFSIADDGSSCSKLLMANLKIGLSTTSTGLSISLVMVTRGSSME